MIDPKQPPCVNHLYSDWLQVHQVIRVSVVVPVSLVTKDFQVSRDPQVNQESVVLVQVTHV